MSDRWITQDRFHDPATGARGNCQQAVVASMLGLPLADVPNFIEETHGRGAGAFWRMIAEFFEARGFLLWEMSGDRTPDCLYMASGPSPRGVSHAVIMKAGRLIHDPHPSRAGIINVACIHVPVPCDPATLRLTP